MISVEADVACKDVDFAIMVRQLVSLLRMNSYLKHVKLNFIGFSSCQVGGFPRKAGMERKDVMTKNVTIYADQASALAKHASKDVKVLVVANPANTNALILKVDFTRSTRIIPWHPMPSLFMSLSQSTYLPLLVILS